MSYLTSHTKSHDRTVRHSTNASYIRKEFRTNYLVVGILLEGKRSGLPQTVSLLLCSTLPPFIVSFPLICIKRGKKG